MTRSREKKVLQRGSRRYTRSGDRFDVPVWFERRVHVRLKCLESPPEACYTVLRSRVRSASLAELVEFRLKGLVPRDLLVQLPAQLDILRRQSD